MSVIMDDFTVDLSPPKERIFARYICPTIVAGKPDHRCHDCVGSEYHENFIEIECPMMGGVVPLKKIYVRAAVLAYDSARRARKEEANYDSIW